MNASRRILALTLVVTLGLLAACGNDDPVAAPDDDDAPPATTDAAEGTDPATDGDDDGPEPTVPDIVVGEVRPVEVIGDPLPSFEGATTQTDPAVGLTAPALAGESFDGSSVRIDAGASGPTMVVFLAHWCGFCNAEVPVIVGLHDAGRLPDGLRVVAVSTAVDPGQPNFPPSRWLEDKGWPFAVMADEIDYEARRLLAAEAFGYSGFPFVTLIDAQGKVTARWAGERGADGIIQLINAYLPGI